MLSSPPVRLGELVSAVTALSARELPASLTCDVLGSEDLPIRRLGTLSDESDGVLSFVANPRYRKHLSSSRAVAVFCAPALVDALPTGCVAVVTPEPYLAYALASQWWSARAVPDALTAASSSSSVHPSACVDPGAHLAAGVEIGPMVVIERGARIGAGVRLGAFCFIGAGAEIGADCILHPHVTVSERCVMGSRGIVHSGAVIGADGFGFAPEPLSGRWIKIAQLGAVRLGEDVEIGANTCIDRGALDDTVIGNGVKLDNLVQIGHNVQIGDHTAMAGSVGVAGSAVIGAHCTFGGGAIVLGHLTVADRVHVSAASVVTKSISTPGHYSGFFPIDDNASWERNAVSLRQLDALRRRVKALEAAALNTGG
jgi:UDP-3-O-[3-hydroxymyristoyl] glucosamine N-acyltransferase